LFKLWFNCLFFPQLLNQIAEKFSPRCGRIAKLSVRKCQSAEFNRLCMTAVLCVKRHLDAIFKDMPWNVSYV